MRYLIFTCVALAILSHGRVCRSETRIYDYQSSITEDANGPLDLRAELNFNPGNSNAPIAVVMHAYSNNTGQFNSFRQNAQWLEGFGFFTIMVAMRQREGSDGVRDSGGLEIYDIYDAVEAVKADPQFVGLIDPKNVHITGYSGGGGNVMSALTKFPDYFNLGSSFFGMSDYGFDPVDGWYFDGANSGGMRTQILDQDVGDPTTGDLAVIDRYHSRASNLASKNNPYSEIHLFVNESETISPLVNSQSYRDNAIASQSFPGEFDNITLHVGRPGLYEDFDGDGNNDRGEEQNWPHSSGLAQQEAGEQWYRSRLLAGEIPQPVLNQSDELFVAGFVKTRPFELFLGDGQNAAGELIYELGDDAMSFDLEILSNDKSVLGKLTADTTRLSSTQFAVVLNGQQIDVADVSPAFVYEGLEHGDSLQFVAIIPEPSSWLLVVSALACALVRDRGSK